MADAPGASSAIDMMRARTAVSPPMMSRSTILEAVAAAVVTLAGALIVFAPLLGSLRAPLSGGDLFTAYIATSSWNPIGWPISTHVGFPDGMDLRYFPSLDLIESLCAWAISSVGGSTFLGVNLVLLLSYPVVGAIAYLTIRLTGLHGPLAIALAVAYALIPFHWDRGLGHVFLATMYSAALAVALALLIGGGWIPSLLAPGARRALRVSALAVIVLLTAWSGIYYACFALILCAAAWLWRLAHRDTWRTLLDAALPLISVAVLMVIGLLPSIIQMRLHPPASPISERLPAESVTYAGNLLMALLPAPISDAPGLAPYNAWASTLISSAPANEATGVGNFGTWVTSACLVVFLVGGVMLRRRPGALPAPGQVRVVSWPLIACLLSVTIAFFIPWGLNMLFASTVTPQIRAWNRLLPVLLLIIVVGAALVLARANVPARPLITWPAVVVILAATISGSVLPYRSLYQGTARNAANLADQARQYAEQVNRAIPGRCGILQLPYVPFPEAGLTPPALQDYEHFVVAALNPGKDFSYGAVKQTPAAGPATGISTPMTPGDVDRLRSRGFCAVHLDLRGYEPGPLQETQVMLHAMLGDPVANGRDGAWLTYAFDGGKR